MKILEQAAPKDVKLYGVLAYITPEDRREVLRLSWENMGKRCIKDVVNTIETQLKLREKQKKKGRCDG